MSDGPEETIDGFATGATVAPNTRPQPSAEPVAVWLGCMTAYDAEMSRAPQGRAVEHREIADQAAAAVIASALEAARREALEQAANVAEDRSFPQGRDGTQTNPLASYRHAAREIAAAIRNLMENPNAG